MISDYLNNTLLKNEIWNTELFGNLAREYFYSLIILLIFVIIFKLIYSIIIRKLENLARGTENSIDDTLIDIVRSLKPPFYFFLALYFSIKTLETTVFVDKVLNSILVVWFVYQIVIAAHIFIDYFFRKKLYKGREEGAINAISVASLLVKIILWAFGLLLVLSNLGVDITSLIAGLGIGGIAVALALQNILGDLFSSFAIYLDRPFVVGDFIIVGDKMGVVQKIGIKTTRIRALQGEEIVMSNKELTSAHIQNFKSLKERRVAFSFGVAYETSSDLVEEIPKVVKEIISKIDLARLDRAHFKSFGDSALLFEVVYYIASSEYLTYMDVQQAINTAIKKRFEELGISMAYPTQTLYVEQIGKSRHIKK